MNIVFFGNGSFGLHTLKALDDSKHNILAIVTNKDKAKGRGLKKSKNELFNEAQYRKIKIIQEDDMNKLSFIEKLKEINADVFIVISYKIIPKEIYNMPEYGAINLHASYLPKYRGSSPIQKALMNSDDTIGLTSFLIDEKIDNGKIIKQQLYELDNHSTYTEVYNMLSLKGGDFILDTLRLLDLDDFEYIEQDLSKLSYAKKIKKNDYKITFSDSSKKIHDKIRSLTLPGCFCYFGNKRLKLFKTFYSTNNAYKLKIGCFTYEKHSIIIGCKTGVLIVGAVQFEGKKIISARDFSNMNIKEFIFK